MNRALNYNYCLRTNFYWFFGGASEWIFPADGGQRNSIYWLSTVSSQEQPNFSTSVPAGLQLTLLGPNYRAFELFSYVLFSNGQHKHLKPMLQNRSNVRGFNKIPDLRSFRGWPIYSATMHHCKIQLSQY